MDNEQPNFRRHWREVMAVFLKLGVMSYGGPAIMGLMQREVQERRLWLSKERFVEGLALVNMLPGAGATQLGIFLGHARAGWWGGVLAGLSFILPAFFIMYVLTFVYVNYGSLPQARSLFYGLAPVVLGIFAMAVHRLGAVAIKDIKQVSIALAAALTLALTPLTMVPILLLAGAAGVALYGSRVWGIAAALTIALAYAGFHWTGVLSDTTTLSSATMHPAALASAPGVWDVGIFFLKVGAFTFGGGLSMLAFMQEQVVTQLQWLTPAQFLDGLALGQLTPGPILMVAAFVGYHTGGFFGALIAGAAIFLPSFILMLAILPSLAYIQRMVWMKAALKGVGPAVIGTIGVALLQMLPNAVIDIPTGILAVATVAAISFSRIGALPLMSLGGAVGFLLSTNG